MVLLFFRISLVTLNNYYIFLNQFDEIDFIKLKFLTGYIKNKDRSSWWWIYSVFVYFDLFEIEVFIENKLFFKTLIYIV